MYLKFLPNESSFCSSSRNFQVKDRILHGNSQSRTIRFQLRNLELLRLVRFNWVSIISQLSGLFYPNTYSSTYEIWSIDAGIKRDARLFSLLFVWFLSLSALFVRLLLDKNTPNCVIVGIFVEVIVLFLKFIVHNPGMFFFTQLVFVLYIISF